MKICPVCGESIKDEAVKCRHCKQWLQEKSSIIVDVDGNTYKTVQIGGQIWMSENLRVTHYRNGDKINSGYDPKEWKKLYDTKTGAYSVIDSENNVDNYGYLYNWYALDDHRRLAPEGWRIPSDDDWKELENTLGMSENSIDEISFRGNNEGSMLAGNEALWENGDLVNNDSFGLSELDLIPIDPMGSVTYYWSSTEYGSQFAWYRFLDYDLTEICRHHKYKIEGFYIRCIKD